MIVVCNGGVLIPFVLLAHQTTALRIERLKWTVELSNNTKRCGLTIAMMKVYEIGGDRWFNGCVVNEIKMKCEILQVESLIHERLPIIISSTWGKNWSGILWVVGRQVASILPFREFNITQYNSRRVLINRVHVQYYEKASALLTLDNFILFQCKTRLLVSLLRPLNMLNT